MDIVTSAKSLKNFDLQKDLGKNRLIIYYEKTDTMPIGMLSAINGMKEQIEFRVLPFDSSDSNKLLTLAGFLMKELTEYILVTDNAELLSMEEIKLEDKSGTPYAVHITGTMKLAIATASGNKKRPKKRTSSGTTSKNENKQTVSAPVKTETKEDKTEKSKKQASSGSKPASRTKTNVVPDEKKQPEQQTLDFGMNPPEETMFSSADGRKLAKNPSKEEADVVPDDITPDENPENAAKKSRKKKVSTGDFAGKLTELGIDSKDSEKIREALLDCDRATDIQKILGRYGKDLAGQAGDIVSKLAPKFKEMKKLAQDVEASLYI